MAIALESAVDLFVLLLWAIAWGLLALLGVMIAAGKAHLNPHFPLIGRPLDPVYNAAQSVIGDALHTAARGAEKSWSGLLNGLQLAFALIILTIALPVIGARKALTYLWTTALPAAMEARDKVIRLIANEAKTLAVKAAGELEHATALVESKIVAAEKSAVHTAHVYADDVARIASADAIRYADQAVARLRTAEDAAIADAARIATAVRDALPAELRAGVSEAEAAAAAALAASDALGKSALDAVRSVAVTAEHDVTALDHYLAGLNIEALNKALPAIATIVTAIAVEAGLENAECRGKVKQICRTDANVWTALLGGAVALGVAFDFADVVRAGVEVEHLAASLLGKLGTVADHDIQKAGRAVGEAAKAIAA